MNKQYTIQEYTIQNISYEELFEDLMNYLKNIPDERDCDKIMFYGMDDSNQTLFEKKSNNLEVGIIVRSEKVGKILLQFLRHIVEDKSLDDAISSVLDDFLYENNGKQVTINQIINYIEESCYGMEHVCDLDDIKTEIWSRKEINKESHILKEKTKNIWYYTLKRNLNEVDIWTIDRIYKEYI